MNELTIEFLRRGPTHNQLLSPLTDYLVLSGHREAQSLKVDFEHRHVLELLWGLRYEGRKNRDSFEAHFRREQVEKMRELVTSIIHDIGGLDVDPETEQWTQLRLVLSPGELAMLPFELAGSPKGSPGNDLPLVLNPRRPVSLTRELRQTGSREYVWPEEPRVLVVAADLPRASVPLREHLAVIRRSLDPWVKPTWTKPKGDAAPFLKGDVSPFLDVVESASLSNILERCQRKQYTHIHILAHGAEIKTKNGRGYGIMLRSSEGRDHDIVTGERLAAVLCQPYSSGLQHRPAVVFIASCDSGARPKVEYTGASTAEVLHKSGVPFVIASQYPLSKPGSVIASNELYPRLFRGEDPRRALYFMRRALFTNMSDTHDWASLVAYSALPEGLERQLHAIRLARSLAVLEAAKAWKNYDIIAFDTRNEFAMTWLNEEVDEITAASEVDRSRYAEATGLLGSAFKRRAGEEWERDEKGSSKKSLERARHWYGRAYTQELVAKDTPYAHWNSTQYLCMCAVLDHHLLGEETVWQRARASAESDRFSGEPEKQLFALGSLAELFLLRPLLVAVPPEEYWEWSRVNADKCIEELDLLRFRRHSA